MNQFQRHIQQGIQEWRLSPAEKDAMRAALEAHMEARPLGAMVSPYSWVALLRPQFVAPLLLVCLFTGTAYAAQGALPGDALYPVKIHVNEALSGALAVSDSAKASFHTQVAAERLQEAQALAVENRLNATTTQELEQDYDTHAALAASFADKVQAQDPAEGAQLHAELSSLGAQGAVLALVGERDGDSKDNARHFAERTRDAVAGAPHPAAAAMRAFSAASLRPQSDGETEGQGAAASTTEDDRVASDVRLQALTVFSALQEKAQAAQATLDASTSAELETRLTELKQTITTGEAASSSVEALRHYQDALSAAAILQTFLDAERKFKGNLLAPLLRGVRPSGGGESSDARSRHTGGEGMSGSGAGEGSVSGSGTSGADSGGAVNTDTGAINL